MVLLGLYGNLSYSGTKLPQTCPYQLALVPPPLFRCNMAAASSNPSTSPGWFVNATAARPTASSPAPSSPTRGDTGSPRSSSVTLTSNPSSNWRFWLYDTPDVGIGLLRGLHLRGAQDRGAEPGLGVVQVEQQHVRVQQGGPAG